MKNPTQRLAAWLVIFCGGCIMGLDFATQEFGGAADTIGFLVLCGMFGTLSYRLLRP